MLTACQQILRQIHINCIHIKLVICPIELLLSDSRFLAEKIPLLSASVAWQTAHWSSQRSRGRSW
ncbi:hypothetical protein ALC56_02177 [Trachymyrmex septentrionalis]|uniref:Uncharacterized protein n=1 Tax=Trachymyrmex septentrionalis TaxID=34720 RepID=A0A195FSN0_9HYME|nr:hypothetical protein ALC56_02177 [Trachymyrmex septentrionalis]